MGLERAHELDGRGCEVVETARHAGAEDAEPSGDGFDQRGAVGEVAVDGALGHAGGARYLFRGGLVGPAVLEQRGEGVDDAIAGGAGLLLAER